MLKIKDTDKILIIAPHPDDEVIACGGFIAKYHNQIDILCINSSGIKYKVDELSAEEIAEVRCKEFYNVANIAQINKAYVQKIWGTYPMIDSIKKNIPNYMAKFNMKDYDYILVPHKNDAHVEHRYVGNVLLRHFLKNQGYKDNLIILRYELWSPIEKPNYYEDITGYIEKKKDLILSYKIRNGMHYLDRILSLNKYRTLNSYLNKNEKYVEAFYQEDSVEAYLKVPDIINKNTKLSENGLNFLEYFKKNNAQEKIDKLIKKYKNKKVVIYGAGQFSQVLFKTFDFSELNIVGIADKRFEQDRVHKFFNLNCIKPDDLNILEFDAILIANSNTELFTNLLKKFILYNYQDKNLEIIPIIDFN